MNDDPRRNLKWLEQELLAEDNIHRAFSQLPDKEYSEDEELLERVDMLIGETDPPKAPPVRNFANNYGREPKSLRAEKTYLKQSFDEGAAVLTKTKKQLRREAKLRKKAEKKASVNRSLKGLVFLALLECMGILAVLGWWLQ